jgi:hypothetical protein
MAVVPADAIVPYASDFSNLEDFTLLGKIALVGTINRDLVAYSRVHVAPPKSAFLLSPRYARPVMRSACRV